MSLSTPSRRRWTESTIESELRAQLAALGHFPTRAELVARGLRSLWDAMRAAGGVAFWQGRLEDAPGRDAASNHQQAPTPEATTSHEAAPSPSSATGHETSQTPDAPADDGEIGRVQATSSESERTASREEIAARAYELYQRGVTGDAVTHWLEAEHQLTSSDAEHQLTSSPNGA